jgi:hypothetical protein
MAIGLWDTKKNSIEVFDASGETQHTPQQSMMIDGLFKTANLKPPSVTFVNKISLQDDKYDKFCQTYTYYFVYQRALADEPAHRIVASLHAMSADERFHLMHNVFTTLLRQGGRSLRNAHPQTRRREFRAFLIPHTNKKVIGRHG